MSEKIAVHCPTEELWDRVLSKEFSKGKKWAGFERILTKQDFINKFSDSKYEAHELCIKISEEKKIYANSRDFWTEDRHTIITAEEYLKEVKDEVIFQIGDRVEYKKTEYIIYFKAGKYSAIRLPSGEDDDVNSKSVHDNELKLLSTNKPKTTKEETMNINNNVLEVFKEDAVMAGKVAARFEGQYGTTDRDTLALKRDKEDLLAIIDAEEKEAAK